MKNKASERIPEGCEFCTKLKTYRRNGWKFKCLLDKNLVTMPDNYDCKEYNGRGD